MKLHLGCGDQVLDGWVNCDIVPHNSRVLPVDLSKPFPWADSSVDEIRMFHCLEHIPAEPWAVLRECWRVLRDNGKIHVKVPYALSVGGPLYTHLHLLSGSYFRGLEHSPEWMKRDFSFRSELLRYNLGWSLQLSNSRTARIVDAIVNYFGNLSGRSQVIWLAVGIMPPIEIEWIGRKGEGK